MDYYEQAEQNRQAFTEKYRQLFDDGILQELYRARKGSLYLVSEGIFAVVPFTDTLPGDLYIFLICNDAEAKEYAWDEDFFLRMFENRKQNNRVMFLTPELIASLYKRHAQWRSDPERIEAVRQTKAEIQAILDKTAPLRKRKQKYKPPLLKRIGTWWYTGRW